MDGQIPKNPVKEIIDMQKKGLSNNQIFQILQRDGFSSLQINDAFNQAKIAQAIKPIKFEGETMVENPMNNFGLDNMPMPNPMQPQIENAGANPMRDKEFDERIQEIAEAVIEEKWEEVVENMGKVIEWKDKVESRLTAFEQKLDSIKEEFDKLHAGILGRVSDYDKHIQEVGTSIKAMEEVFKKMLPGFVENINKLDDITKKIAKK